MSIDEEDGPLPLGVSAKTGRPFNTLPDSAIEAFRDTFGQPSPEVREVLDAKFRESQSHLGVIGGFDPNKLNQVGWGILYAPNINPDIPKRLEPLIEHRKKQVNNEELFKIYEDSTGYLPGDTAATWLLRQDGVDASQSVDPDLGVPYYIMIVAPSESIPFEFQYLLDVQWAVGRLWFDDVNDFARYAESVVRYETMDQPPTSRQLAIFSTRHEFDKATQALCDQVATPLVNGVGKTKPIGANQKFKIQPYLGDPATAANFNNILRGDLPGGSPAILFSGSHGMGFELDDPELPASQGAILCQDWAGYGEVSRDHYFDATNVPADAKVHGMVYFLFACFGVGWPQFDDFSRTEADKVKIAPNAALARLPQRLLAHPNGGALAVVGHVDRAWTYSFRSSTSAPQTQGFRDILSRVMIGERLGKATDQFNVRWAALSTELSRVLDDIARGLQVPPKVLANQWVARDDARNYIIFGDPAVGLRVDDMKELG